MKLVDLEPRWAVNILGIERHGMGITFLCPCCLRERLGVMFKNPIDGKGPSNPTSGETLWTRTGDTFETLTLTPSIDASRPDLKDEPGQPPVERHWHGFITNGEIV